MSASHAKPVPARHGRPRFGLFRLLRWFLAAAIGLWVAAALCLAGLRWINPPFTAVQAQRRIQAVLSGKVYQKRQAFAGLDRIAPEFQHAVVAAEDARFYQHRGFDWTEIQNAMDDESDRPARGASTITQQLVKNLFFGTGRSYVRKGIEASLVPVAEFALGKRRILELYLNVAEWGPGVYGAEAAAKYHYQTTARKVDRAQAQRLAAILPSPLRRRPERMTKYSTVIDARMRQMGW